MWSMANVSMCYPSMTQWKASLAISLRYTLSRTSWKLIDLSGKVRYNFRVWAEGWWFIGILGSISLRESSHLILICIRCTHASCTRAHVYSHFPPALLPSLLIPHSLIPTSYSRRVSHLFLNLKEEVDHFGCVAIQSYLICTIALPFVVVVKSWIFYPRSQNLRSFWQIRFRSLYSWMAVGLITD